MRRTSWHSSRGTNGRAPLAGQNNDDILSARRRHAARAAAPEDGLPLQGLRIEIVDTQKRPMFATAQAIVQPYMHDILQAIGNTLNDVPNRIVVQGHTDAVPYAGGEKGYSNWELSADRANASFVDRRTVMSPIVPSA